MDAKQDQQHVDHADHHTEQMDQHGFKAYDKADEKRDEKHDDKKDEGKKEDVPSHLMADKERKEAVEKLEKHAEKEKEDTAHIRTGGRDTHHDLLPEVPVQVVTDGKTGFTKAMPFVETKHDPERAVEVKDDKKK